MLKEFINGATEVEAFRAGIYLCLGKRAGIMAGLLIRLCAVKKVKLIFEYSFARCNKVPDLAVQFMCFKQSQVTSMALVGEGCKRDDAARLALAKDGDCGNTMTEDSFSYLLTTAQGK